MDGVQPTSPADRAADSPGAEPTSAGVRRFPCAQCGAGLDYVPGTRTLVCTHCGHANAIAATDEVVEELDFAAHLHRAEADADHIEPATVKCEKCAASVTRPLDVVAFACPFCGTNIIAQPR